MRREAFSQVKVIQTESASDFQEQINSSMRELADKQPEYKLIEGKGFCAIISYQETIEIIDKVADEYHAEGIYYLCKHCPYLDDPHDKRVKRCTCKYSSSGVAYKDSEACEVFYKALKRGDITPLPDYAR